MTRTLTWVLLGFSLVAGLGSAKAPQATVEILEAEAAEHRIGTRGPIYTNNNIGQENLAVTFEVMVGTDGKAVCSRPTPGFMGDLTLLCETWKYKPFERNGQQVAARVPESVKILPISELREVHIPFPEIRDWNSLRIALKRSGCYGTCPTYKLEIHGDGTVLYDREAYVRTNGEQKAQISHESLVTLVNAFRQTDFLSRGRLCVYHYRSADVRVLDLL